MAKVSFNKLGLKINDEIQLITFNDQEIEIKQYLPVNDKLVLTSEVINSCAEDSKFYNPGKIEIYFTLEMIFAYTNIKFTDKQKEDVCKLYDLLQSSGLKDIIFENIPDVEISFIYTTIIDAIENIYKYNNSVYGILDNMTNDYDNLNFDITDMWKKLSEKENVEFLQEVIQKMG
jgi:hypothetical protein